MSSSRKNSEIFSFDLQEINHGVLTGCGTGSMSWDSSIGKMISYHTFFLRDDISVELWQQYQNTTSLTLYTSKLCYTVMGLYFAMNQSELRGNILELGSGVGLGGILSNITTPTHTNGSAKRSVTLTDINDDVLHMLEQNITHASSKAASLGGLSRDDISIQKLDWFDSLLKCGSSQTITNSDYGRYDTIIASDCAYLRDQIIPLTETISKLLGKRRRGKEEKKKLLHMFAPYNRGVV